MTGIGYDVLYTAVLPYTNSTHSDVASICVDLGSSSKWARQVLSAGICVAL